MYALQCEHLLQEPSINLNNGNPPEFVNSTPVALKKWRNNRYCKKVVRCANSFEKPLCTQNSWIMSSNYRAFKTIMLYIYLYNNVHLNKF